MVAARFPLSDTGLCRFWFRLRMWIGTHQVRNESGATRFISPDSSVSVSVLADKEELLVTESNERPLVYTVTQTAALLGISRTHAYELVARGDLAHVRLGRRIVVPRHSLERLLDVVAERPAAS